MPNENEIPFGWRLASLDDIEDGETYNDAAIEAMSYAPTTGGFFCLDDEFKVVK